MPFVSITRLRLRSWKYLPGLYVETARAALQALRAGGNLSLSTLRDTNNVYWTRTVWTDEAAMRAYMTSGAHRAAMPKFLQWCDEAAVAHWTQRAPMRRTGRRRIGASSPRGAPRNSRILPRRI